MADGCSHTARSLPCHFTGLLQLGSIRNAFLPQLSLSSATLNYLFFLFVLLSVLFIIEVLVPKFTSKRGRSGAGKYTIERWSIWAYCKYGLKMLESKINSSKL